MHQRNHQIDIQMKSPIWISTNEQAANENPTGEPASFRSTDNNTIAAVHSTDSHR